MYENITTNNFVMYAIKHYDNPQCEGEKEFHDDMKRFKYIKRLFKTQKEYLSILKSFLIFLNMITEDELTGIESDNYVLKTLRTL